MEKNQKINNRTGPNHYYTVLPNKSAQGGFFSKKNKRTCSFIRQTRITKLECQPHPVQNKDGWILVKNQKFHFNFQKSYVQMFNQDRPRVVSTYVGIFENYCL